MAAGAEGRLRRAGFIAAGEEAAQLLACADGDERRLDELVARRLTGEPLAWITRRAEFCGIALRIDPGVYVPRPHTELLATRAAERLGERGLAIDLCTGCGAVAKVLANRRPGARVLATDVDERAVACARANGVEAYSGDLLDGLPGGIDGAADVITAVVPYVPAGELALLPRDTLRFESTLAYEGGADGADVLRRAIAGAPAALRPGGALLLELGGDQAELIAADLEREGFGEPAVLRDEEGDPRGVEATLEARG